MIQKKLKKYVNMNGCNCNEHGIVKSAIKHTISILLFIVLITLIFNCIIYYVGEDKISSFVVNRPVIGPMLAALIGLIPNCASSVILTKLYLTGVINVATMLAGLLAGAGSGVLVLYRVNRNWKENVLVLLLIYFLGVISGVVLQLIGISNFILL